MHKLNTFLFLASLLSIGFLAWRQLVEDEARAWFGWRMMAPVPLVAIGLFAPNIWVYYAAILATMMVLPRSRVEAAGLYLFISFLLPLSAFDWSIGTTPLLRLQGSTVAAVGLLTAFRFPGERGTRANAITAAVLLLAVVQVVLSSRTASVSITSVGRNALLQALSFVLPYLLVSTGGGRDIRRLASYLAAVGFMLAIVSTFEMTRHWPLYQTIDANLGALRGVSRTLSMRGGLLRAAASFSESTSFGLFLAITTGITLAMPSLFRSRATYAAALAVGAFGCFTTLSRNAWISLIVAWVAVGLYRRRFGVALGVGGVATLGALALITLAPDSGRTAAMLGKGDSTAATTATYRSDLIRTSIPFIKRSPVVGTPIDQLRYAMRDTMKSQEMSVDWVNAYLYYLTAGGVVSLFIYLFFVAQPLAQLNRVRLGAQRNERDLQVLAALFGAQATFSIAMFGTSFAERLVPLAIFLAAATRLAANQVGRQTGSQMASPPTLDSGVRIIDPLRPTRQIPVQT